MSTTKKLKLESTEIVLLETLLENFNNQNPHPSLKKISDNVLKNIQKKKEDYAHEFDKDVELYKSLKTLINADLNNTLKLITKEEPNDSENEKQESICNLCQFKNSDECLKQNEMDNYWGEEDGIQIVRENMCGATDECIFYEVQREYTIKNLKNDLKDIECVELEEKRADEEDLAIFKCPCVDIFLFQKKYGNHVITNYDDYKEKLDNY